MTTSVTAERTQWAARISGMLPNDPAVVADPMQWRSFPDRGTHSIERSDDAGQHAGQRRLVARHPYRQSHHRAAIYNAVRLAVQRRSAPISLALYLRWRVA
jgi:hypothetical protein